MRYARNVNNRAVDVRETDPEGHYTPNIVAEFLMVPDDVQDGWELIGGVWTNPPLPSAPTADEIAAAVAEEAAAQATYKAQSDTEQAASVRASRTQKLKDCDWTQIGDSTADKAAWATYRQALRDVTTQDGFPWTVEWPVQP
jgi:hypothetical protein